jgi:Sec-independent protein translocase protein TatA
MFGMTPGELFVVTFIVVMVVSAPWWPRIGEAVALGLRRKKDPRG